MFRRLFEALEIEFLDFVSSEAYDEGDVLKDQKALGEIKELAEQIN